MAVSPCIIFNWTLTDVVDDPGPLMSRDDLVGDDPDVRKIAWKAPRDQIPGEVMRGNTADRQRLSMARQKDFQVRHTPVVNVRIGRFEAPGPGVRRETSRHVLVHERLKVDALSTVGTDHEVRAHAQMVRDVSHRISDPAV
jgi:hypothetical protein